jgi:hypothetical protein
MLVPIIVVLATILPPLVVLGLALRDTIRRKGRWGVNLWGASCKKCGEPMPLVRVPRSLRQTLWGGWTCAECGFELDKWGVPMPNQTEPAKWKLLDSVEHERRARRDAAQPPSEEHIQGTHPD